MSRAEYAVTVTAREQAALMPAERDATALKPRDVAGRTLASIVSTGTELNWCFLGEQFPSTPGYAAVFEVEDVGADVSELGPGDVAFGMGHTGRFSAWTWRTWFACRRGWRRNAPRLRA